MLINTKYFNEIEVAEKEKIFFPSGIFGFEDIKEYFLLFFEDGYDGMVCLQSATDPQLAFIMLNPYTFHSSYTPKMSDQDFKEINAEIDEKLMIYTIAVIKDDGSITANLKCPIVINVKNNLAAQIIIEDNNYSMRYPIIESKSQIKKAEDKEGQD